MLNAIVFEKTATNTSNIGTDPVLGTDTRFDGVVSDSAGVHTYKYTDIKNVRPVGGGAAAEITLSDGTTTRSYNLEFYKVIIMGG